MKKVVSFLVILSLTMTTLLVSCNKQEQPNSEQSSEHVSEDDVIETFYESIDCDEYFQGQPYQLVYTTDKKGTCCVSDLLINPEYSGNIIVEIPEKSPEGDIVSSLAFGQNALGCGLLTWNIPLIICAETFDALCDEIKSNGIGDFDYSKFTAYYLKLSLEGLNDRGRQELLEVFPIVEAGEVYVFDNNASYDETTKIIGYYQTYLDWNTEKTKQCYDEIIELAKSSDTFEWAKQYFLHFRDEKWLNVTEITIPNSVSRIEYNTFKHCIGLKSITIPDSVTYIGNNIFFGCTSLTNITVSDGNIAYHSVENCIIGTESKTLVAGCKSSVIPADGSVTSIDSDAFKGCTGLTSITIPDSVTSIDDNTFKGCTGLTSITIPDSVTNIGYSAFEGCSGLTSITIPDSVTSISHDAFKGCTGLTSITIPDSVTSIIHNAFKGCTALTDVYYTGTEQDWLAIFIDSYNDPILNATIHYNYVPEE